MYVRLAPLYLAHYHSLSCVVISIFLLRDRVTIFALNRSVIKGKFIRGFSLLRLL